jgi:hypothetical protein
MHRQKKKPPLKKKKPRSNLHLNTKRPRKRAFGFGVSMFLPLR